MMAAIEVEMKQRFGFRKNVKMIVRVGSWNSQIPFFRRSTGIYLETLHLVVFQRNVTQ